MGHAEGGCGCGRGGSVDGDGGFHEENAANFCPRAR